MNSALVLILSGALLGWTYYYVLRHHKKEVTWTVPEAVYNFVKEQFRLGYSEERIKRELTKLDWSKDLPRTHIEEYDLKKGSVEDQGALVLRFVLGFIFMYRGLFLKLLYPSTSDVSLYGSLASSLRIPLDPHTALVVAGLIEMFMAILLLAGLWTRIVACLAALFLTQLTVIVTITGDPALDMVLLLTISMAIIMLGGGSLSADRYIGIP